ncbi:hypothetical protein S40288_03995 [Stachybotrys chartarum IBT 40288]|nr:hypothetical protein S40288_03995 [Stachybotrys chartarum IBT 40288]
MGFSLIQAPTPFNLALLGFGGWLLLFGIWSALASDRYYLSFASLSFLAGILVTSFTGFTDPLHFIEDGSPDGTITITAEMSRIVLGVQLLFAGMSLPRGFLRIEWKSLGLLLGPGLVAMWICSSLVVWALVPWLDLVPAMAIAACITPTDPVLSIAILEGRFADEHVPQPLRHLIIAESGANDGLGYIFLFLALNLIRYNAHVEAFAGSPSLGETLGSYFGYTCLYVVGGSILYGWALGHIGRYIFRWADQKGFTDRQSFLAFPAALALFILGSCGVMGLDDVLACFIAGNTLTWDAWFHDKIGEDLFQEAVDRVLNLVVFMWLGVRCPWASFWTNDVLELWRLFAIGFGILVFRRLPMVLASYRFIHQIPDLRQALFVGFFGPIGVSAIFYLCIGIEFLGEFRTSPDEPSSVALLQEPMVVIVWFMVAFSVIVHGFSIPIGMLVLRIKTMLPFPRSQGEITL